MPGRFETLWFKPPGFVLNDWNTAGAISVPFKSAAVSGRERRVWGASPKAFGGPVCQNSAYGHTRSAARRADRKQRRIQACL